MPLLVLEEGAIVGVLEEGCHCWCVRGRVPLLVC